MSPFARRQPLPPSDELRARLGANVREHRKRLGISQEEFAFRAEIHPTAASKLEIGQTSPYIHTFIRVAGGLGVTTDDLTAGILWTPPETIITPGVFEVPDDPDLTAEVAALRAQAKQGTGGRKR
jgi:transcriptional regulator with XRE-family HTH domain